MATTVPEVKTPTELIVTGNFRGPDTDSYRRQYEAILAVSPKMKKALEDDMTTYPDKYLSLTPDKKVIIVCDLRGVELSYQFSIEPVFVEDMLT